MHRYTIILRICSVQKENKEEEKEDVRFIWIVFLVFFTILPNLNECREVQNGFIEYSVFNF